LFFLELSSSENSTVVAQWDPRLFCSEDLRLFCWSSHLHFWMMKSDVVVFILDMSSSHFDANCLDVFYCLNCTHNFYFMGINLMQTAWMFCCLHSTCCGHFHVPVSFRFFVDHSFRFCIDEASDTYRPVLCLHWCKAANLLTPPDLACVRCPLIGSQLLLPVNALQI